MPIVINTESGTSKLSSNSSFVYCIHFHSNALVKGINSSFFFFFVSPPSYGLNNRVVGDSQSRTMTALNSKLWRRQQETTPLSLPKSHSNSQIIKKLNLCRDIIVAEGTYSIKTFKIMLFTIFCLICLFCKGK